MRKSRGWSASLVLLLSFTTQSHMAHAHSEMRTPGGSAGVALESAHVAFYNGRYLEAADRALEARERDPDNLSGYELRSSAYLFQLRRALARAVDKRAALKACELCGEWTTAFFQEANDGRDAARKRLASDPSDDSARYFLAKLDLNIVWLQLDALGRRKGWSEYWEARQSLDAILKRNPQNVRARIARAWIDYIVDTRVPRGVRWLLGGGDRLAALVTMREMARLDAEFFVKSEAAFSLWEMEIREKHLTEAVAVARGLARDFPENRELIEFLSRHDLN